MNVFFILLSFWLLLSFAEDHSIDRSGKSNNDPDRWQGVVTNFSRKNAKKVAVQLGRNLGCKPIKSADERAAALKSLVPPETADVSISATTLDRALTQSKSERRFRDEVRDKEVCRWEIIETVFNAALRATDKVDFSFTTPSGSKWAPLDVAFVTDKDERYSLAGLRNCATGDEVEPDERSADLGKPVRTNYAIQNMGYLFRGHGPKLPVSHLEQSQRAGWHIRGPKIWGAFTKNAAKLDVKFGPIDYKIRDSTTRYAEAATIDVTGIRWGLSAATLRQINTRVDDFRRQYQETADNKFIPLSDRNRVRDQLRAFNNYPAIDLHSNDQNTDPRGTEVYVLYDKDQTVDMPPRQTGSRPIYYHTMSGERPRQLAASGDNPREGGNYSDLA